ncbi:MAG: glycosyltransferase family 2 protein [Saprospiraceae bacterium]
MKQRIIAVLPAYNEEASLPALLNLYSMMLSRHNYDFKIMVINDGSEDQTAAIVMDHELGKNIELVDNKKNGGLGKVLKQGLAYATQQLDKEDIIITMDCDNSHNPNLIPRMISYINEGSDIVIASRYRPGARIYGLGNFRKLISLMAGSFLFIFAPIKGVRDYTCGFRAYKVGLLQKGFEYYKDALIEENGFSCMVELLLKLNYFKPIIHEVPMILRYDQKMGTSKMKIWATIKKTLVVLYNYKTGFKR